MRFSEAIKLEVGAQNANTEVPSYCQHNSFMQNLSWSMRILDKID